MDTESTLTAQERTELVLRLLSKAESAAQIARRAGITEQTLHRWREAFLAVGKRAMDAPGAQSEKANTLERLRAEQAEGDQVIGDLTVANRLLKDSGALS